MCTNRLGVTTGHHGGLFGCLPESETGIKEGVLITYSYHPIHIATLRQSMCEHLHASTRQPAGASFSRGLHACAKSGQMAKRRDAPTALQVFPPVPNDWAGADTPGTSRVCPPHREKKKPGASASATRNGAALHVSGGP